MKSTPRYQFKIAGTQEEFDAIHRLNYRTFVEEIPQHEANSEEILVDRFHHENTYVICLNEGTLAGMIAVRFQHPFSLEEKLGDLSPWLPPGHTWCEIRLLAVEPAYRGTPVTAGLLQAVAAEGIRRGCDATVISATTRQLRLYGHVGFTPFAHPVGRDGAWYQPMYLLLETLRKRAPQLIGEGRPSLRSQGPVNLLPGPVETCEAVRSALCRTPVSHRDPAFLREFQALRHSLASLTNAAHVSLMPGSGTLANEVICQRLKLLDRPGIVLSCGEFGERLADHARRSGLAFRHVRLDWGAVPDLDELARTIDASPGKTAWLWTPHCETSTGVTLSIDDLRSLCAPRGIRLCLDCVSTVGVLPVDLRGVHLASCSSGKGLASLSGVAIVFHQDPAAPEPDRVPRYLDLGLYATDEGVPFTHNGNLILALKASLDHTDWPEKFCRVRGTGDDLRRRCVEAGLPVLGGSKPGGPFSPGVITLTLPPEVPSLTFAAAMEKAGFVLSAHSGYLRRRNWVQICLLGDFLAGSVADLPERLRRCLRRTTATGPVPAEAGV